jgi:anti-repressor protein
MKRNENQFNLFEEEKKGMNDLVKVTKHENLGNSVNARELWFFLESKQRFTDWIKNRVEKYEFVEKQDYIVHKFMISPEQDNQVDKIEYIISLDMAKELAMVENNDRGKRIRKYFIAVEKKFQELNKPSEIDPRLVQLQILSDLTHKQIEMEKELKEQKTRIENIEDRFECIDQDTQNELKKLGNSITKFRRELIGGSWNSVNIQTMNDIKSFAGVNSLGMIKRSEIKNVFNFARCMLEKYIEQNKNKQIGMF